MVASPTPRLVVTARWGARIALVLLVLGPSALLLYAWVEVLNNPGLSLVDGYWIGRLPWIPIGVVASLAGGVIGLLAGSCAISIAGGWWRRLLIVPAYGMAALWWSMALGVLPVIPRFTGPDPVTLAYSLPSTAAIMALLPGALLAVVALTPRGMTAPRTRLRPVPSVDRPPRPRWDDEEVEAPPAEAR